MSLKSQFVIANVAWNVNKWKKPDPTPRPNFKYTQNGVGHEGLNFKFDKNVLDDDIYVYGYIPAARNAMHQFEQPGIIFFYSTDPSTGKRIVGVYGNANRLDDEIISRTKDFSDTEEYVTNIRAEKLYSTLFTEDLDALPYKQEEWKRLMVQSNYRTIPEDTARRILYDVIKICKNKEEEATLYRILNLIGSKQMPTSQEQLEKALGEQKEIGEMGEQMTMKYERRRLKTKGLLNESARVEQTSKINTRAGYDISSFKGDVPSSRHDYFIEVKARKHNINSFIITANELRQAKEIGSRYAIYFWKCISDDMSLQPTLILENPVKKLGIEECKNCLAYIVDLDSLNLNS